jgi:4-amino-4-deoxy-L-arabinose transferase-like glycosyltransferase
MSGRLEIILCLLIASLFAAISYSAIRTKSPTYDEPMHFGGGYAHAYLHDDRTDPENPLLFKFWPMLVIPRGALHADPNSQAWLDAGQIFANQRWSIDALFARHPDYGMALLNRARLMMVLLGVFLCLASAWWAHQIAGPWAATAASLLIALDPNFLAHAPLVKNDVPMTLALLVTLIAMWRVGNRVTILNVMALALACAVSINVKLSAVLVPQIVAVVLLVRAMMSRPWVFLGRRAESRARRLLVVFAILLLVGVVMFGFTWTVYGFRYAPSDNPNLKFAADEPFAGGADYLIAFASKHHLLPEAFCIGFLRQHTDIHSTLNYLLGAIRVRGWWYYFPFVFLVKSPIATLVAALLAILAALKLRSRQEDRIDRWTTICLLLPSAIYLLSGMMSDYDHGIRSMLPIVPPVYVAVAVTFARVRKFWPRSSNTIAAILLLGLAVETLAAFPDYIPFFNVAAGGSRGGMRLLGDSNIDWGQDLSGLVQWHREHPDTKIYLAYYGGVDPTTFGVPYTPLPGYYAKELDAVPDPHEPGVLAISATLLQGIYVREPWTGLYAEIRTWKPREVIGGSIYLYDIPSPEMTGNRRL